MVTCDDADEIQKLQRYLASEFEMNDLGSLKYFLGIKARLSGGIFLSQRKYVLNLLTETSMLGCEPVDTPVVQNHHLGVYHNQISTNKERYQSLIGRIIYLLHTRPDIAYAISVICQFMHSPSEDHIEVEMCILSYLKFAPKNGLFFIRMDIRRLKDIHMHIRQTILLIDAPHQSTSRSWEVIWE